MNPKLLNHRTQIPQSPFIHSIKTQAKRKGVSDFHERHKMSWGFPLPALSLPNGIKGKARGFPSGQKKGLTLVEMTLYVAIFSIFMSFALGFFWQMQKARIQSGVWREGKENAAQALELLKSQIRNADGLDLPGSQLGQNLSALSLTKVDGTALFDTYVKPVVVGGIALDITKLRLALPSQSAEDVTSDHVTVTRFEVSDVGGGGLPTALQIRLGLAAVNPGTDPLYDSTLDSSITVALRAENP